MAMGLDGPDPQWYVQTMGQRDISRCYSTLYTHSSPKLTCLIGSGSCSRFVVSKVFLHSFCSQSSLNITMSCVQYRIRHGLVVKVTFLAFCLTRFTKLGKMGLCGNDFPAHGSFGPGTNTQFECVARSGNSLIRSASAEKLSLYSSESDPAYTNDLLEKLPIMIKASGTCAAEYPAKIIFNAAITLG